MIPRCHRLVSIALLLLAVTFERPAFALIDFDPNPPMRWNEMLACQTVVLATYQSHQDKTLSLTVLRVLKGDTLKPGDTVKVTLENRYSWQGISKYSLPTGVLQQTVPQLCYQEQIDTLDGPLSQPILNDARQPAVYFFPKADTPALARPGQVQAAVLADGWRQALDGQPISLIFQLGQTINLSLQRDALEELYLSRDPATLDMLFSWVFDRPQPDVADAQAQLTAIGDRNGDVYNRALQLFLHPPRPQEQQWRRNPADEMSQIMAQVDPHRALQEFRNESQSSNPTVKKFAFTWAEFCGTEEALNLGFDLLQNPHTMQDGLWLVRGMLCPEAESPQPRFSADKLAALQEYARPRLLTALHSSSLTDAQKKEASGYFSLIIGQPLHVSLAHAEAVLIHPTPESSTGLLLEDIRESSDPKLIPLLIQTLSYRPSMMEDGSFGNVLIDYAHLFPKSVKRQLAAEGIDITKTPQFGYWQQFRDALGQPQDAADFLFFFQAPGWQTRVNTIQMPPAVVQEFIADTGQPSGKYFSASYLQPLLQFAPTQGVPLLKQALDKRIQYEPQTQAQILDLAFQYLPVPDPAYVPELRDLVRVADDKSLEKLRQEQADSNQSTFRSTALFHHDGAWDVTSLTSSDTTLSQEYLRFVDALRPLDINRYGSEVSKLCLTHPADGFPRVLALLESDSLPEREAGEGALVSDLYWDFGFQSADFAPLRAKEIAALRPRMKSYEALTEIGMRADVLRAHGIMLSVAPSREWLPTLSQAALRLDPAISQNALALIESLTGENGIEALAQTSPDRRRAALAAFYADRGITGAF